MRRLTQLLSVFALLATLPTEGAVTPIAAASPGDDGNLSGPGFTQSTLIGFNFVPAVDIEVMSLGIYDTSDDGLETSMTVGFFAATGGSELARVDVPAGAAAPLVDSFRYVDIAPVVLEAGQEYGVVTLFLSSGASGGRIAATPNFAPEIGPAEFVAVQSNLFTDVFFTQSPFTSTFFGANFLFNVIIPEPATSAVALLGVSMLTGVRCRFTRC